MDVVAVVTQAVRDEARKWFGLADETQPVRVAASELTLDVSAFFIGDVNAAMHHRAYEGYQAYMVNVLRGAVEQFDLAGAALNKIADEYDRADAVVAVDLNAVWTRRP
jgi:hypothetical protein